MALGRRWPRAWGCLPNIPAFSWAQAGFSGFWPIRASAVWLRTHLALGRSLLAFVIFLPNLWWQSHHHWMTFAFQFGRVTGGHLTGRYLLEFIGAQLGLATPFILMLVIWGGVARVRRGDAAFSAFVR